MPASRRAGTHRSRLSRPRRVPSSRRAHPALTTSPSVGARDGRAGRAASRGCEPRRGAAVRCPAEPAAGYPTTCARCSAASTPAGREFRAAAARFPSERMDEHLSEDGWTRKQMLVHIGVWHDLTTERLSKFFLSGSRPNSTRHGDDQRRARQAIGRRRRDPGRVTFNRLRRQLQRLTDQQLGRRRVGRDVAGTPTSTTALDATRPAAGHAATADRERRV